jgi:hypothetical protein
LPGFSEEISKSVFVAFYVSADSFTGQDKDKTDRFLSPTAQA